MTLDYDGVVEPWREAAVHRALWSVAAGKQGEGSERRSSGGGATNC